MSSLPEDMIDRELGDAAGGGIGSVGIVGGGFMGTGIAESVALAGMPVIVVEVDAERAREAGSRIEQSLERAVAGGKVSDGERVNSLAVIETTVGIEQVARCDLVIEAVPEESDLKAGVMREVDAAAGANAILASNTSSIPIAQLAAAITHPERMLGLHFFAPVPVMKLVEVVRALDTADEVVHRIRAFAGKIGKTPIVTKDRSGFVVNMLLVPYLMAAVRMYEEGFATREDIDVGMQLGCGYPMGPLRLCDLIGIDVLYAVCDSLYEEFKRDEYAPPPLLKRMLAAGRLGRKSGRGFYEYGGGPEAKAR
jgi:3-hydroxybutyryl-CoA dehydrogenase